MLIEEKTVPVQEFRLLGRSCFVFALGFQLLAFSCICFTFAVSRFTIARPHMRKPLPIADSRLPQARDFHYCDPSTLFQKPFSFISCRNAAMVFLPKQPIPVGGN
jgi:hypothetical protein